MLLSAHPIAAIPAADPIPFVEADMGAIGVVGFQDLPNERNEVKEPALGKRGFDGRHAVALT